MSFFSLASLSSKARETFVRFPLSIAAAAGMTVVTLMISHYDYSGPEPNHLYRALMGCYLVMLLSISVSLYAERFTFSSFKKNISLAGVIVLGVLYYYSLPEELNALNITRFVLFTTGLHFLVSFAPFMVRGEMNGLWQFNKYVFIRAVETAIYSAVLCLGLLLALAAVDNLFDVRVSYKYYSDIIIIINGIFFTWFFLAGFPQNLPSLEDDTGYPKGLRIFTVYILLPLVCIYLAILYAYGIKILVTGQWPVGWVSYLVIIFSVFGILSFLLIHPLRDDESQPWVKVYSRLFYFLLGPLIALLFVAIFMRVFMYGITVERYFVVLLACWLTFISGYMLVTRGNNIRIIPVSLFAIAFLSSFGPWGAFDMSRKSQVKELSALLDSNHVLQNGIVDTAVVHKVTAKDYDRIVDIVRYIDDFHGYKALQPLFAVQLDSVMLPDGSGRHSAWRRNSKIIVGLMNLEKIYDDSDTAVMEADDSDFFVDGEDQMLNSAGYDFVIEFAFESYNRGDTLYFLLKKDTLSLSYSEDERKIRMSYKDMEPLVLDAGSVLDSLFRGGPVKTNLSDFTMENDNREWKARLIFSRLSMHRVNERAVLNYGTALLCIKLVKDSENEVGERKE